MSPAAEEAKVIKRLLLLFRIENRTEEKSLAKDAAEKRNVSMTETSVSGTKEEEPSASGTSIDAHADLQNTGNMTMIGQDNLGQTIHFGDKGDGGEGEGSGGRGASGVGHVQSSPDHEETPLSDAKREALQALGGGIYSSDTVNINGSPDAPSKIDISEYLSKETHPLEKEVHDDDSVVDIGIVDDGIIAMAVSEIPSHKDIEGSNDIDIIVLDERNTKCDFLFYVGIWCPLLYMAISLIGIWYERKKRENEISTHFF